MPATQEINAPLIEVFSSIQGEGVLIGCRQVFVRFADCNLSCEYCDTPFHAGPTFNVEIEPGSGQFAAHENPANLVEITRLIGGWQRQSHNIHHSVALTGGEPLLHADILKAWLPEVRSILPVFLETNGTLPDALKKILPLIDMISMDIKGSSASGVETQWDVHADFVDLATEKLCQVKLVVDASTPGKEVLQAARLVHQCAPECPLILQPRTLGNGLALNGKSLLVLQQIAAEAHQDVRVIPQIHPWLCVS